MKKKKKKLKLGKLTVGRLTTQDVVKVKGGYYVLEGGADDTTLLDPSALCTDQATTPQRCAISGGN